MTDSSLPPRFGAWRFDTAPPETDLPSESGAWLLGEGRPNPALVLDLAEVIPENTLPQAIQIAGWAQNPIVRLYGLERLIDRCQNASHETLERVLAAVLTLKQDAWRAAMVGELAPWLLDAGLGTEMLDGLLAIERGSLRATALGRVAGTLESADDLCLLNQALAITAQIQEGQARARALTRLALYLRGPEAQPLLAKALATARAVEDPTARARALVGLARYLWQEQARRLQAQTLEAAQEIETEPARAKALAGLAPYLPLPLLAKALATARTIQGNGARARALAGLARRLPEEQSTVVWDEALDAAQAIGWDWARMQVLAKLAANRLPAPLQAAALAGVEQASGPPHPLPLPEPVPRSVARRLFGPLAEAWQVDEGQGRLEALAGLAPHLPQGLMLEALAAAREIEGVRTRARALVALAPHLGGAEAESLLAEALAAVMDIETENSRAWALAGLAPHLATSGAVSLLAEALAAAWEIGHADYRAHAQDALWAHLQAPEARRLLGAELAAALELRDLPWQHNPGLDVLRRLVPYLPDPFLEAALDTALGIEDEEARAKTLEILAPYLPESLLEGVLEAAALIEDEAARAEVLANLAPYLPESLTRLALDTALAIEDQGARLEALRALVPYLPDELQEEAGAAEPELGDDPPWWQIPVTGPGDPEEVLMGGGAHGLLEGLPEDARREALEEALRGLQDSVQGEGQARVVNTGFAASSDTAAALSSSTPLLCGQVYYFWLEVGAPLAGSIEEIPTVLPTEHLPHKARLKVALHTLGRGLALAPGAAVGEVEIQDDGSVLVTGRPAEPADLVGGSDLLDRRLFFPVLAGDQEGVFSLRCSIYHEQTLLQSRLVQVHVLREARPLARALRSTLDFSLNRTLQPATLAGLGAQTVSMMADEECKGSHCLHFFGAGEFNSSATFDGQELAAFLDDLRGAMRKAAWGREAPYIDTDVYRYDGPQNGARLKDDLVRFAKRGYQFYAAIISRLAGGYGQLRELANLMAAPGTVQIASKSRARFLLPVAMIYDYGLDTNAPAGDYTLCPDFVMALNDGAPLEESSCFQGHCPSRGSATTVCPSGFWGYRHNLGLPLSVDNGPELPPEIVYPRVPELAVAVSTDKRFQLRDEHVPRVRALRPDAGWHYADRRDATLKMLRETDPHLVYLYCHGGMSGPVPFIQVGPRNERGITPDNLLFNGIQWPTRPLVFVNGCHTAALTPDVPLEFVSTFLEMSEASAVIGTEITIFEPLAVSFAEAFLPRFLAGTPLGAAVRGARLALLKEGNPLGLVYIPYALAGLRLVQAQGGA